MKIIITIFYTLHFLVGLLIGAGIMAIIAYIEDVSIYTIVNFGLASISALLMSSINIIICRALFDCLDEEAIK